MIPVHFLKEVCRHLSQITGDQFRVYTLVNDKTRVEVLRNNKIIHGYEKRDPREEPRTVAEISSELYELYA